MIYIKIKGLILDKIKVREKDAIVYILTEKYGVWKCSVKGIYRPESKNLTLMEPGNINNFFIITDFEKNIIVSSLPLKIMPATFKKYPLIFLWTLKIIKKLNLIETPTLLWFIMKNINRYLNQGPNFSYWFIFQLLRILGYEIDLDHCLSCGRKLKKFAYFSSSGLYCHFCRKPSHEKINQKELNQARKIKNLTRIPKEVPFFLKKIIRENMVKLKQ